MSKEREILKQLFPYLDRIICYASTIEEHLPNRLYKEIQELLAKPETEPDYWHVVDKEGNSLYSAIFKQACIDHINEAMTSEDFPDLQEEIQNWVIRPLWNCLLRQPVQLSDDEIATVINKIGDAFTLNEFARAVIAAYEEKQNRN